MKAVQTQSDGFLIIVNEYYGCYTDKDGNFNRSVEDIVVEVEWAKDEWKIYEEKDFPLEKEQVLLNQLQYVQEYKKSLVTAKY